MDISNKSPKINVDILVVNGNKTLVGLLTERWNYKGKRAYGFPGRDILFQEKIGDTIKRSIQEDLGCGVEKYKIISVNANYALGNHYVGIGVIAEIDGEPKNLTPKDWEKWQWFDKKMIPKNLFPAAKNLLESYLNNKINVSE